MKFLAREKGDIRCCVMGFAAKNPGSLHRFCLSPFHLFTLLFDSKVASKMELVSGKTTKKGQNRDKTVTKR